MRLTHNFVIPCRDGLFYNPRVMTLAAAVKTLRGDRKAIQIARQALGPEAALPQLRSWANYLGRIERGEVGLQNPSLEVLDKLAKGLGVRLSEFFKLLEGVPTLLDPQPQKPAEIPQRSVVESDTSKADSNGAQIPAHAIDSATLAGAILEAADHIASACDRLATAVAAATETGALRRQAPAPRAQSPKRRRSGSGRV